jgi:hypothetical protein
MKKGDYVRITKIASVLGGIPACPMPLYSPGAWHGILSLPQDYWMEGVLAADVAKGDRIRLDRVVRLGVVARGFFTSSPICTIRGNEVGTYNSVWQVNRVPAWQTPATEEQPLL